MAEPGPPREARIGATGLPRILIVASPYYPAILELLLTGAERVLVERGADFRRIHVPGALEIPPAIRLAATPGDGWRPDGFIALGCVIRGETSHFDIVAGESARGIMELGIRDGLAIGNGILTVETAEQAHQRADPEKRNTGGHAAQACLALTDLRPPPALSG